MPLILTLRIHSELRKVPLRQFHIAVGTERTTADTVGTAAAVAEPAGIVSGTVGTIPCRRCKSRKMGRRLLALAGLLQLVWQRPSVERSRRRMGPSLAGLGQLALRRPTWRSIACSSPVGSVALAGRQQLA